MALRAGSEVDSGNDCFARFGELESVNTLISDDGLDVTVAADLQAAGPRVVLA